MHCTRLAATAACAAATLLVAPLYAADAPKSAGQAEPAATPAAASPLQAEAVERKSDDGVAAAAKTALPLPTALGYSVQQLQSTALSEVLPFGLPTSVTRILVRDGIALCYDCRTRNAIWVAEHLTAAVTKKRIASREGIHFSADEALPQQWRAELLDFAGSGYDRGHLAPAGNLRWSDQAMSNSFKLSNISPQVGRGFNRHYWARLEKFVRDQVNRHDDVFVFTGGLFLPRQLCLKQPAHAKALPYSSDAVIEVAATEVEEVKEAGESGGSSSSSSSSSSKEGWVEVLPPIEREQVSYEVIGRPEARLAVPTHFYKVVLTRDGDGSTAVAAFVLPNKSIDKDVPLSQFEVELAALEDVAGFSFFPSTVLRDALQLCAVQSCKLPEPNWWLAAKKKREKQAADAAAAEAASAAAGSPPVAR